MPIYKAVGKHAYVPIRHAIVVAKNLKKKTGRNNAR